MNSDTIALLLFFGSSLGIGSIILRKIVTIAELDEVEILQDDLVSAAQKRRKIPNPFENFSSSVFLEKLLKRVRIISLKTDYKTFSWLQKLKENNQKKKIHEDGEYWEEIKKATKR